MGNGRDVVHTYVEMASTGEIASCEDLSHKLGLPTDYIFDLLHHPRMATYVAENFNLAPPPRFKTAKTLTDRQLRWLAVITNPYTTKTINGMIAANSDWMTQEDHRRWMQQAAFQREYNKRLGKEVKATSGEMVRRTAQKAMAGDVKSIELIYRMQGEPLPTAIAAGSSSAIPLETILTALQKELDGPQLARVAARLMGQEPEPILELEALAEDLSEVNDGTLSGAVANESVAPREAGGGVGSAEGRQEP